jgi:hypothetical protein
MIVDNLHPYTDDMAHQAAFMLDRLQSSSSGHPVVAVALADHLGLAQEQVWGIAEYLAAQHRICFALEDPSCIFTPVSHYWLNGSQEEAESLALMTRAIEANAKETEGLQRAADDLRGTGQ